MPRKPEPPGASTERVRRWRKAHPERNAEQGRRAQERYQSTAKGQLATLRGIAKNRGAS